MAETQRSVSPVILIVGGVAIVAAALYALWAFVLSGNPSSPTNTASAVPSAAAPGGASADPSASADGTKPTEGEGGVDGDATQAPGEDSSESTESASQILPETFEVYTARNPFEQLIRPREDRGSSNGGTSSGFGSGGGTSGTAPITSVPGPGGSSSSSGSVGTIRPNTPVGANPPAAGSTPVGATSPSSPPSAEAAGSSDGTSNSAGTGAGGQVEVGATRVRLQSVGDDNRAVVTVNGVDYNPTVGEQFAQRFKLLSVNKASGKDCATMLFGDSRFSICAGQVIDK